MSDSIEFIATDWRKDLPVLTLRNVTLREPSPSDLAELFDLLAPSDAAPFGMDDPVTQPSVHAFIERVLRERRAGSGFAFAITRGASRAISGLVYVRQLDPSFEAAEWEMTLAPSARGAEVFVEVARLVGSFAFGTVGAHRLEARVPVSNGRANGAMHKLGAVQEGVLRRSIRRRGEYLDQALWSVLKEDWGSHWVSTAPRVH